MAMDKNAIKQEMSDYATKWNALHPNTSQTTLFRRSVPMDKVDFTETFQSTGLNQIFTGDRLRTDVGPGRPDCNHLFRSTRSVPDIPLYSDEKNTVLGPLGEPGRDVNKHKVSHLMVVPNGSTGPVDFNLMLPSTSSELLLLDSRREVASKVFELLKANSPISECGPMVAEKAAEKGLPLTTGIREYFALMIDTLPTEVLEGPVGYNLLKGDRDTYDDGATTLEKVAAAFDSGGSLKMFIQPPSQNTQIITHIHLFVVDEEQPILDEKYVDVDVINDIKMEYVEDVPLVRTRTPPCEEGDPPLARCVSSRNVDVVD